MSALAITYKGETVTFAEHADEWRCDRLELANSSLTKLKERIDALSKEGRKLTVQALRVTERFDAVEISPVTITLLCEPPDSQYRSQQCWVKGLTGRQKVSLDDLYPVEALGELTAWAKMDADVRAAAARAKQALAEVTAFNADTVALAAAEAEPAPKIKRQRRGGDDG